MPAATSVKKPASIHKKNQKKSISYAKWGYLFIAPFFLAYALFSLYPLLSTFYNSLFENYMNGLSQVGPNFIGLENFKTVLTQGDLSKYFKNTVIIWLMGFIPQFALSLLLAAWFTDLRLRLKALGFFKTVIYLPNLIMATAFSMLFFALFSDAGPVNSILLNLGAAEPVRFLSNLWTTRGLIALMNFLMWFGNTAILLMAAIMGVDTSLYEAAEIDGATSTQSFWRITVPLIKPIFIYVFITSMIGGIQLFDVPQILTNGQGNPNRSSMTLVMYLNKHLFSENFGMAGAVSVLLFLITGVLSGIVFLSMREGTLGKGGGKR
ncbi:carbohydrate ABC transporter permease [Marasmitruncus massiliensis]|uniref:carbohydrate ABC transporter permease n=1 Tax=Marasmitruncus massiliensis TaxID=1944642 RepID=UPI000C79BC72|nr:sugar ABC transporter permease [Marasmitruncus massiliensis]